MNKKSLISRLLDNWPVKIICLIISIFLYIFHQTSIIDKKNVVVPLKIIENGLVMHVGTVPSAVAVVVRGNDSDVKSIVSSDFEAVVNLDNITEKGSYQIPVQLNLSDKLMEYDPLEVKLKDRQVNIKVDYKETKYVEFSPSVVGDAAHGYTVSAVEMNPSFLQISGAKSVLDKITFIETTKINVSNAKNTFKSEVEYIKPSKNIEILEETPFTATVIIAPLNYEKQITNINIEARTLSDEFEIISTVPKLNVLLKGTMPDLESYEPSENFAYIDCSEIQSEGTYTLSVKLNVPKKFETISKSFEKVNIKVIKKTNEFEENLDDEDNSITPVENVSDNKNHKDLMMSKVEGAVNNMLKNENPAVNSGNQE